MKKENLLVKGFTLIEMVVVIAIIGALIGVLAPTMSNYYAGSRIKSANSNAKMVYNAAQTAVQEFLARDRTASTASPFKDTVILSYYDGKIYYNDSFGGSDGKIGGTEAADSSAYKRVADSVNATVSGAAQVNWAVCVQNYIVKGCISADQPGSYYVGYYSAGTSGYAAGKTTASERSATTYNTWFKDASGGTIDCLRKVCEKYDTVS